MTIQEAYNKGLDVAENEAHDKLSKALEGLDSGPFNNPKMEDIRLKIISLQANINDVDTQTGELCDPCLTIDYSILDIIESIILDKEYISTSMSPKHCNVLKAFESLMDHFKMLASKKHNVGKAFAKILKDQQKRLTSE